jgi:enoyl reductase-like protein
MTAKLSELADEAKAAVEALKEAELYHHNVEHILQNASQLSTDLETRLSAAKPPVQAPEETHWVPVTHVAASTADSLGAMLAGGMQLSAPLAEASLEQLQDQIRLLQDAAAILSAHIEMRKLPKPSLIEQPQSTP